VEIFEKGNNIMQTAYSIKVASDEKFSTSKIVWQSGKVESDESLLQLYKGSDLKSGQRYFWQVKIWIIKKGIKMEYPCLFRNGTSVSF